MTSSHMKQLVRFGAVSALVLGGCAADPGTTETSTSAVTINDTEVGRRKFEKRFLAQNDQLFIAGAAVADARLVRIAALESPQDVEKIETIGLRREIG